LAYQWRQNGGYSTARFVTGKRFGFCLAWLAFAYPFTSHILLLSGSIFTLWCRFWYVFRADQIAAEKTTLRSDPDSHWLDIPPAFDLNHPAGKPANDGPSGEPYYEIYQVHSFFPPEFQRLHVETGV
jgi:hypothetical protein